MANYVKVSYGFSPKAYSTMSEALLASDGNEQTSSSDKCHLINGHVVLDYEFDGTCLIIHFDNGKYLTVLPGSEKIEWDVVNNKPDNIVTVGQSNDGIMFELSNGEKFKWNWREILNSFIGKQIAISPSEQYLFIFSREGSEYVFSSLLDEENINKQYLMISET
ncbi:MAG: hypothetical protein ABW170_15090 [Candidatus Thiodiazotropha sp. L084R]